MPDTHDLVLCLHWIDGGPTGTAALHSAPERAVAFAGWLELAAAVNRLTDPRSPPA